MTSGEMSIDWVFPLLLSNSLFSMSTKEMFRYSLIPPVLAEGDRNIRGDLLYTGVFKFEAI